MGSSLLPPNPVIILLRPQMAENIGATARAMKNFGLTDLRLVAPRDGWVEGAPPERALAMSSGADEILLNARCTTDAEAALKDLHCVYATTGMARDMVQRWLSPRAAAQEIAQKQKSHLQCGIVFGPERSGLTNEDLTLCNATIAIPTTEFFSLNLAQAVNVLAYEWFCTHSTMPAEHLELGDGMLATAEDHFQLVRRLFALLTERGFFATPEQRPTMERNIRNSLQRGQWTQQEMRTWHGIITSLLSPPLAERTAPKKQMAQKTDD